MNERIKQLALQALKHPDNDNDGLTVFDNDELEKFAELIVRECAGVGYDASYYECALNVSNKIKQHFGVEGVLLK
jgi:hypothetical protein